MAKNLGVKGSQLTTIAKTGKGSVSTVLASTWEKIKKFKWGDVEIWFNKQNPITQGVVTGVGFLGYIYGVVRIVDVMTDKLLFNKRKKKKSAFSNEDADKIVKMSVEDFRILRYKINDRLKAYYANNESLKTLDKDDEGKCVLVLALSLAHDVIYYDIPYMNANGRKSMASLLDELRSNKSMFASKYEKFVGHKFNQHIVQKNIEYLSKKRWTDFLGI